MYSQKHSISRKPIKTNELQIVTKKILHMKPQAYDKQFLFTCFRL